MDRVSEAGWDGEDHVHTERFRALFEHHLEAIWRFARRRCDSGDDADDITAETFAVAWRRRTDLPPPDEVRLWLFGVARRILANHRRTTDRQGRLHLRIVAVAGAAPPTSPAADADIDRHAGLATALAALDPDDRELLLLRAWDGLEVQQIAGLLGCTPNAASIRLHRARGRLAAALATNDPTRSRTSTGRTADRKEDTP